MKKQGFIIPRIKSKLTWVVLSLSVFVAVPFTFAQEVWESGDEWRAQYKVGDKVQFSISGNAADFQVCTVSENTPQSVMRVKCEAFKQWVAGTYIVYGKSSLRPLNTAGSPNDRSGDDRNVSPPPMAAEPSESRLAPPAPPAPPSSSASPTSAGEAPAALGGTYWALLSMTKKGETAKESSSPPDVEFCKNGEWGILHYGGTREAGKFSVSGGNLVMKYEDGSLFGNFKTKREGNILILDDGEYVLRLRYVSPVNC